MAVRSVTRIQLLSILVILLGLAVIARLFSLQVLHGGEYRDNAERQYVKPSEGVFERGEIYFSGKDGTRTLAAGIDAGFTIAVNQKVFAGNSSQIKMLAEILGMSENAVAEKVSGNDPHVLLKTRVSKDVGDKITKEKIKGIEVIREKWRTYPGGTLSAQTLGYVGWAKDGSRGLYGLERYYEETLSREEGNLRVNFFADVFLGLKRRLAADTGGEGNILLTIEPSVGRTLESVLEKTKTRWNSELAGGIVMNPKTGEILAMDAAPSYDPNAYGDTPDISRFRNPNSEYLFEFGSVVKPLVMAGAIEKGAVTPEMTYEDRGYVDVGSKRIHNFDKKGRGKADMEDVLVQSLNTGMVYVGQKMGKDAFQKNMLSFGITEKTGIDLPNEETGNAENLKSRRDVEYATASFGQGISMTPIELLRAFSAFGNGGKMITPYIVSKIDFEDKLKKDAETEPILTEKEVVSAETAETITRMLTKVADNGIQEGAYKMEHYRIAAKTGTAQIPKQGGGYHEDQYLHSLIGYYPAYDPEFLVLLYQVNPRGVNFAAVSLAEPFFELAKFLLSYYNVAPDR